MDIVAAINDAPEGATVKIPAGTYVIEPKIKPKKGVTVDLTGVTLQIGKQSKDYHVLLIEQPGITIKGGTLVGNRETLSGYGVRIRGQANNVRVDGTTCKFMALDGFMIHGGTGIKFNRVTGDGNRRQGLSICDGSDIRVLDSVFKNTAGTPPQAGIDIEPWEETQLVNGVLISGCQLLNNRGHGITINGRHGPIRNVRVEKCIFRGNKGRPLNYWGWSKWQQFLADLGFYKPTSIRIA